MQMLTSSLSTTDNTCMNILSAQLYQLKVLSKEALSACVNRSARSDKGEEEDGTTEERRLTFQSKIQS